MNPSSIDSIRRFASLTLPLFLVSVSVGAEPVSFRNDVMAVLSRAGCNSGPCHGNLNGKNGFKLSLRGEDPDHDWYLLTRAVQGRRIHLQQPDSSLVIQKALALVPHEGGRRFGPHSREHRLLRHWIEQGARQDPANTPVLASLQVTPIEQVLIDPADQVSIRVVASFSDGSQRDVTALSALEINNDRAILSPEGTLRRVRFGETIVLVRYLDQQTVVRVHFLPARPDYRWKDVPEQTLVDRHVFARLRMLSQYPADLCADPVFLRRVYLDVLGILPSVQETRAFLADTRPNKRALLIDELLTRPEFADFWALKWSDLLRNEEKVLDRKGVQVFHDWIRDSIADGKPLNVFAHDLLASRGSSYSHPASNFYRALRDPQARAEAMAQVFLGIRLQCARCHNHPFDRWKQDDYHSLAAFFARVRYKVLENRRQDNLDQHEFDGEQIVWMARQGEVLNPRTREPMAPKFLGAEVPPLAPTADRLQALADWVARPDNPFLARVQVNRIWYHLMGHGIVDPIDDFRASNPPSNPGLLDALAEDFVRHGFDLRHTMRVILNSRTYQLSAVPREGESDDRASFARAQVRPLQAEQLLDALCQVTETTPRFAGIRKGLRAGQVPGAFTQRERGQRPTAEERFLATFGKPMRSLTCECERSEDSTLGQAFQMITGSLLDQMLAREENRLGRLLRSGESNAVIVEELYLAALARYPNPKEAEAALARIDRQPDRRATLEDLLWALVNAKEFLLRR